MNSTNSFMRHPVPFPGVFLGIIVATAGCGSVVVLGSPAPDAGPGVDVPLATADVPSTPADRPGPRTCTRSAECAPGEACTGGPGCGVPWTCGPALGRPCTDDLAVFCGCDGQTFMDSSSCPGRPYRNPGACAGGDASVPGCNIRGTVCPVNTECRIDRCTSCRCDLSGTVSCRSLPGCATPDAGVSPPSCTIQGVTCAVGETCRIDRCTACFCQRDGNFRCTRNPDCMQGPDPGRCAPQDARGEGDCEAFFGFAWNGARCVGITGCRCNGADCMRLSDDPAVCVRAYEACLPR